MTTNQITAKEIQQIAGSKNIVKIGRDSFIVQSIKEAVQCWVAARNEYCWGASEAPRCNAVIDGRKYRISYNGRVWDLITEQEVCF